MRPSSQGTSRISNIDSCDIGYSEVEAIIHEWVIGKNAARDREILHYWLLDGLTQEEMTTRYMLAHPDMPISKDTVKRIIKKRAPQIFKHFPG